MSADDKIVVEMHLSGGEYHDGPEGRISIEAIDTNLRTFPCSWIGHMRAMKHVH